MRAEPSASLIITAFNNAPVLARCLEGFAKQSVLPNEVIIADDGSAGPDVPAVLLSFANRFPKLIHVWHPDHGYQRSRILNRAILASSGTVLVFTDSDCIPERHFVQDHRQLCIKGHFCQGSRSHVRITHINNFSPELHRVLSLCLKNGIYNRQAAFRIPALERFKGRDYWNMPLGGNFSCRRDDIIAVNGFDERFEGWGAEDVDLFNRLKHFGVAGVFPKFLCITYHLDHISKSVKENNMRLAEQTVSSASVRCDQGLDSTHERVPSFTSTVIHVSEKAPAPIG